MWFFRSLVAAWLLLAAAGCCEPELRWKTRGARLLGLGGSMAEDPVSGRAVVKDQAVRREYKGSIYYFEDAQTAAVFDRDPSLYAVVENVPPRDPDDVR